MCFGLTDPSLAAMDQPYASIHKYTQICTIVHKDTQVWTQIYTSMDTNIHKYTKIYTSILNVILYSPTSVLSSNRPAGPKRFL